jgi:hypothetical protein
MRILFTVVCALCLASCSVGHGIRERAVSVRAVPQFKEERLSPTLSYYTVSLGDRDICWPENAPKPESMKKHQRCDFRLLEVGKLDNFIGRKERNWSPELVKVVHDGSVLYDASICPLHHTQMARETVKISYGLPAFNSPYWQAFGSSFQKTAYISGGCCSDGELHYGRTWVCPTCVRNERNWKETHR